MARPRFGLVLVFVLVFGFFFVYNRFILEMAKMVIKCCGFVSFLEGATPDSVRRRSDQIRADIASQNHHTREPEESGVALLEQFAGQRRTTSGFASAPLSVSHTQTNCKNKKYVSGGRCSVLQQVGCLSRKPEPEPEPEP